MSSDNNIVTGWCMRTVESRRFGFASTSEGDVFFHMSGCREVEGTPENPVLTDKRCEHWPQSGGRNPDELIMVVEQGPKGLRAKTWGIKPKRTWLEKIVHERELDKYVGGSIHALYRDHRGQFKAEFEDATIKAIHLDLSTKVLTISCEGGTTKISRYGMRTPVATRKITIDMDSASKQRTHWGHFKLTVYTADGEIWLSMFVPG